jgi:tetratricopeptide (TPR) repeat protein
MGKELLSKEILMNNRLMLKMAIALACFAGVLSAQQKPAAQQGQAVPPGQAVQPQSPVAKQPSVKSVEEGDAITAIFGAQDTDTRIKAADAALEKYPDTEFKSVVLFFTALSYQEKNDYEKTIAYAERTLAADPENYQAMVMIARNTAIRTKEFDLDREEKLATVEKQGNHALEILKTAPRPNPNITDQQWDDAKKDFTSQIYEAYAMAAVVRNKPDQAIELFQKSIDTSVIKDPTTMLRLGAAFSKAGKYDDAIATLDKVMAIPNLHPTIRQVAQSEKTRATQLKNKAAAPGQPAPAKP